MQALLIITGANMPKKELGMGKFSETKNTQRDEFAKKKGSKKIRRVSWWGNPCCVPASVGRESLGAGAGYFLATVVTSV